MALSLLGPGIGSGDRGGARPNDGAPFHSIGGLLYCIGAPSILGLCLGVLGYTVQSSIVSSSASRCQRASSANASSLRIKPSCRASSFERLRASVVRELGGGTIGGRRAGRGAIITLRSDASEPTTALDRQRSLGACA
jgi:hypothetical protein